MYRYKATGIMLRNDGTERKVTTYVAASSREEALNLAFDAQGMRRIDTCKKAGSNRIV
jgi:hypothetical protein